MLMVPMYLLIYLKPSTEPIKWEKLTALNVVPVLHATLKFFVSNAHGPNILCKSTQPFLTAKKVEEINGAKCCPSFAS